MIEQACVYILRYIPRSFVTRQSLYWKTSDVYINKIRTSCLSNYYIYIIIVKLVIFNII